MLRPRCGVERWAWLGLFLLVGAASGGAQQPGQPRSVSINEVRLTDEQVGVLERQLGMGVLDGSYWYDAFSGAYGNLGGPAAGFIAPGLAVGGPLKPNASNGNTGVFINGRELHVMDALGLQTIVGVVIPGRYWVDSRGFFGVDGGARPWET